MTGLRFRETMTGRLSLRTSDPEVGYRSASGFAASLRAGIDVEDVAALVAGEKPDACLRAELIIPVLGGRLVSDDGKFILYQRGADQGRPVQQIVYTATFVNDDRVYEMSARKILQPSWHPWRDTTTLHVVLVDVTRDADTERPRHVAGLVKISAWNFLVQLTTMHPYGAGTWRYRMRAVVAYDAFFIGGLVKTYLRRARW